MLKYIVFLLIIVGLTSAFNNEDKNERINRCIYKYVTSIKKLVHDNDYKSEVLKDIISCALYHSEYNSDSDELTDAMKNEITIIFQKIQDYINSVDAATERFLKKLLERHKKVFSNDQLNKIREDIRFALENRSDIDTFDGYKDFDKFFDFVIDYLTGLPHVHNYIYNL